MVMCCCLGIWCSIAKGEGKGFSGRLQRQQGQQRRRDAGKLETTETTETQRRREIRDYRDHRDAGTTEKLETTETTEKDDTRLRCCLFRLSRPCCLFYPFRLSRLSALCSLLSALCSLLSPLSSQRHNTPTPPCYDVMALWRYVLVVPRCAMGVNTLDINVIQSSKLNRCKNIYQNT